MSSLREGSQSSAYDLTASELSVAMAPHGQLKLKKIFVLPEKHLQTHSPTSQPETPSGDLYPDSINGSFKLKQISVLVLL